MHYIFAHPKWQMNFLWMWIEWNLPFNKLFCVDLVISNHQTPNDSGLPSSLPSKNRFCSHRCRVMLGHFWYDDFSGTQFWCEILLMSKFDLFCDFSCQFHNTFLFQFCFFQLVNIYSEKLFEQSILLNSNLIFSLTLSRDGTQHLHWSMWNEKLWLIFFGPQHLYFRFCCQVYWWELLRWGKLFPVKWGWCAVHFPWTDWRKCHTRAHSGNRRCNNYDGEYQ